MNNTFIKRGLIGIPIGIVIGYIMSIFLSLAFAGGHYGAHPEIVKTFGNEINAVIVQTVLWGVLGFVFSGFSVFWEKDNWSLTKQTISVFLVYLLTILPIGYVLKWIKPNFASIALFILIFVSIFISIWVFIYFNMKQNLLKINGTIKKNNSNL